MIQQLLGHLDANSRSPASVRAGIVEVLSEAAVIEATGSVGQSDKRTPTTCASLHEVLIRSVCAAGPTVLEVFNTLLRQLRQSVDYQLTGYYDNAGKRRTTSREEKTLQDAVIKTIGQARGLSSCCLCSEVITSSELLFSVQDLLPTRFPSTRGQRSCCSSWGRSLFLVSTPPWGRPTPGTTHTCSTLHVLNIKNTTDTCVSCRYVCVCLRFEGSRMIQVMLLKSLLQVNSAQCCCQCAASAYLQFKGAQCEFFKDYRVYFPPMIYVTTSHPAEITAEHCTEFLYTQ